MGKRLSASFTESTWQWLLFGGGIFNLLFCARIYSTMRNYSLSCLKMWKGFRAGVTARCSFRFPEVTTLTETLSCMKKCLGYKFLLVPWLPFNLNYPSILFSVCHMTDYLSSVSCVLPSQSPKANHSPTSLVSPHPPLSFSQSSYLSARTPTAYFLP